MNREKGITLITLMITLIVMLIIAGVTFYAGSTILKQTKLKTIIANMLLIEAKAKTIKDRVEFTKNAEGLYGNLVESPSESEIAAGVTDEKWYKWDKDTFEQTGLAGIDKDMIYYVNYETMEVIYLDGYAHTDGNKYYKLSELKEID